MPIAIRAAFGGPGPSISKVRADVRQVVVCGTYAGNSDLTMPRLRISSDVLCVFASQPGRIELGRLTHSAIGERSSAAPAPGHQSTRPGDLPNAWG